VQCVIYSKKGHASCIAEAGTIVIRARGCGITRSARNDKLSVDPGCIIVEERSGSAECSCGRSGISYPRKGRRLAHVEGRGKEGE